LKTGSLRHGHEAFTGNDLAAIRTTTALHRIVQHAIAKTGAEIVLIDVGPNLGAINRAALLAADTVVMPLAADLFSLRGLHNLGATGASRRRKDLAWMASVQPPPKSWWPEHARPGHQRS
jgi:chromosome partitioning protein